MPWTIVELRHNASVLYHHLCSDNAHNVYVDTKEHLQIDNRHRFLKRIFSLGDYSREATDKVAIRTLKRVLKALEDETLDASQVIILDLKKQKWVTRVKFGMDIGNAARFKMSLIRNEKDGAIERPKESELSHEQKVCKRVSALTTRIICGNSALSATDEDCGYNSSDDEAKS
jgi:hypothetical protein